MRKVKCSQERSLLPSATVRYVRVAWRTLVLKTWIVFKSSFTALKSHYVHYIEFLSLNWLYFPFNDRLQLKGIYEVIMSLRLIEINNWLICIVNCQVFRIKFNSQKNLWINDLFKKTIWVKVIALTKWQKKIEVSIPLPTKTIKYSDISFGLSLLWFSKNGDENEC